MRSILTFLILIIPSSRVWAANFDYDSLVHLIEDNHAKSVAQTLQLIASKYPQYMANRTAMIHSGSLQEGSLVNPRVLIFGEDASLVITFNGSPEERGFQSIELIHFDFETNQFTFQEILFPEDLQARKIAARTQNVTEREQEQLNLTLTEARFSEPNPKACLSCHTETARPIWQPYPSWPGTFAPSAVMSGPHEEKNLRDFALASATNSRFTVVPNFIQDAQAADREKFLKQNEVFNSLIQKNNFRRMVESWSHLPHFYDELPQLESVASCTIRHATFTPSGLDGTRDNFVVAKSVWDASEFQAEAYDDVLSKLTFTEVYPEKDPGEWQPDRSTYRFPHYSDVFWRLRYVVENKLGGSMFLDATTTAPGTYLFTTPDIPAYEFLSAFQEVMKQKGHTFTETNCPDNLDRN